MPQYQQDERGIPFIEHNGKAYYNRGSSAKYLGMSDTGYARKRQVLKDEDGIEVPIVLLPVSRQTRFIDKRILDVFRQSVRVGEEDEWKESLRKVINEVNSEG